MNTKKILTLCAAFISMTSTSLYASDKHSIVTTPYFGLRSAPNIYDLIVMYPSAAEDLFLLQQKQNIEKHARKLKLSYPNDPFLEISGKAEMSFNQMLKPSDKATLTLGSAELDLNALVGSWVSTFISVTTDIKPDDKDKNNNLRIKRAFLSFGNLNKSPLYLSGGHMYVPFGRYSSADLSSLSTFDLGHANLTTVNIGYAKKNLHQSAYVFQDNTNQVNNKWGYGVDFGYKNTLKATTYDLEIGIISNMLHADHLTDITPTLSKSAKRMPGMALDLKVKFPYGFNIIFGAVSALNTKPGNTFFTSSSSQKIQPWAIDIETGLRKNIYNKPSSIYINYQQTEDTQLFQLPHRSYAAILSSSLTHGTVEAIEFRRNQKFSGTHEYLIIAKAGIYF